MKSSIQETVKKRLIESAKSQYGEIVPCGDQPFTEQDDMIFFWFNDMSDSTHMTHTHLIHEDLN